MDWVSNWTHIEAMIAEEVPEVTEVVDGTDHEAGTNPYYE